MSSARKFISGVFLSSVNFITQNISVSTSRNNKELSTLYTTCGCIAGTSLALYAMYKNRKVSALPALSSTQQEEYSKARKLTGRKRHFIKFASVEYNGQLFMTPQDFLDAMVEQEPKSHVKRHILTQTDLATFKKTTPSLRQGSTQMFRTIGKRGIISYTECLFLLSVLTNSQDGFKIAFNMFDKDGNKIVTKSEFVVMERIFSNLAVDNKGVTDSKSKKYGKPDRHIHEEYIDDDDDDVHNLPQRYLVDTTLILHFFGKDGQGGLHFKEFEKFMDNLQTEVLELEYQKFSNGKKLISEVDFAKILLRYTNLQVDNYNSYIHRLSYHLTGKEGISFNDFRIFCQFLNNLEDFTIAMKIYKMVNDKISQEEFHHAVKVCTGACLSKHVINTVFLIFDKNGDGQLSYEEFIQIMKDRIHRGFKSYVKTEGWQAFKTCVNREMKIQQ